MAFHIREVESRSTPKAPVAASNGSHTSLGRLLRQLADPRSDDSHMAAAILHAEAMQKKRTHTGGEDVSVAHSTVSAPLPLAEHRQISNLETVIRTADQAIEAVEASDQPAPNLTAARNLLKALATAAAVQSVEECTSTKHNVCVWTKQSKKRLLLLLWMLRRSDEAADIVLQEVLASQLKAAKGTQMAACLVVFELAQRVRAMQVPCTTHWNALIDPLETIVTQSSVTSASGSIKPSKLGVMALDALLVVLCIVVSTPSSNTEVVQNAMERALKTSIAWYEHSTKRHWLIPVAMNLRSIVQQYCDDPDTQRWRDMVSWHWNATAPWLCSRSDSVLVAKRQLSLMIERSIDQLYSMTARSDNVSTHHVGASLRRLCALFSLHTGDLIRLRQLVIGPSNLGSGKLLVVLSSAMLSCFESLVCNVLRLILLDSHPSNQPLVELKPSEAAAFLVLCTQVASKAESSSIIPFIAESYLHFGLPFPEVRDLPKAEAQVMLQVICTALDMSKERLEAKDGFYSCWHRQACNTVLNTLCDHVDEHVRTQAASLLPRLDLEMSMRFVASELFFVVDTTTFGSLVELIFMAAEDNEALNIELSNILVDFLCLGTASEEQIVMTPSDYYALEDLHCKDEIWQNSILSRSTEGWCKRLNRATRVSILSALTRRVFCSPRDTALLTWMRELSLLGWFDECLREVLIAIIQHMTTLERLSEELLEDTSSQSSKAVETLLFARLAPNLVLRVIPRSAFMVLRANTPGAFFERGSDITDVEEFIQSLLTSNHVEPLPALVYLLWRQVLDPLEYKEIKMISAELLTKLPVEEVLPNVLGHLIVFLMKQGCPQSVVKAVTSGFAVSLPTAATFTTAKLMMYFLNRVSTDNLHSPVSIDFWTLERTSITLLSVLGIPCRERESFSAQKSPLVDLQMGAIECLALLVAKSLTDREKPTTVEQMVAHVICGDAVTTPQSDICHEWIRAATTSFVDENAAFSLDQVRVCCCNVLLSALSKLDVPAQLRFANRVLSEILTRSRALGIPPSVQAACLQVAFAFVYKAGNSLLENNSSSRALAMQCVEYVAYTLHGQEGIHDQMLMAALKLLGALIGKLPWFWPSIVRDVSMHKSIADGLQMLRDSSSPQVTNATRQLASSLLEAIFPM